MNFITKTVFIGVSVIAVAACSNHDGANTDAHTTHKPEQMAAHNPQMHKQVQTQNQGEGHKMHAEQRMAVHLSTGERQHVLAEMRGLLQSTQNIVEGLATDDMELVQQAALAAGTQGRKTTENNIMHKKMPAEWMQLGMTAHKSMDEIAGMAKDGKSAKDIQLKLAKTMNVCTACHGTFYLPDQ